MVKRVSIARRREGMSHAAFRAYPFRMHAPLSAQIQGTLGYRLQLLSHSDETGWDAIAEMWFESEEAARAGLESEPIASKLKTDRPNLVSEVVAYYVLVAYYVHEEDVHVVLPPPPGW